MSIDLLSCIVLLVAAGISFWLRTHTNVPDIFGLVSEMVRDHESLSSGNEVFGIERTRALGDIKVRVTNLSTGGRAGHIGLVVVDDTTGSEVEMKTLDGKQKA